MREGGGQQAGEQRVVLDALDIAPGDRATYDRAYERLRTSRQHNVLCGGDKLGMLLLVPIRQAPPFHLALKDYARLQSQDMPTLRKLLALSPVFNRALDMANKFVESALSGGDGPTYRWHLPVAPAGEPRRAVRRERRGAARVSRGRGPGVERYWALFLLVRCREEDDTRLCFFIWLLTRS